jgi:hypothetical protein
LHVAHRGAEADALGDRRAVEERRVRLADRLPRGAEPGVGLQSQPRIDALDGAEDRGELAVLLGSSRHLGDDRHRHQPEGRSEDGGAHPRMCGEEPDLTTEAVRIATGLHESSEAATHGGHEVTGAEAGRELHTEQLS